MEQLIKQVEIAKLKSELAKYKYEELIYTIKLDQFINPDKYDKSNKKTEDGPKDTP
jgi:hypothetical protein